MSVLFSYRALDAVATLRVDAPGVLSLAGNLHSCVCVSAAACDPGAPADLAWREAEGGQYAIELFGHAWGEPFAPGRLFFQSENLVTQVFSERHKESLQLHAAAVLSPDGRGVVITGESGAGKTSMTLGLMAQGWKWLTDELALVGTGDFGRIRGVPRNFNIKEVSFPFFPETAGTPHSVEIHSPWRNSLVRFVDPSRIPSGGFATEAPLGGLVFPQFSLGLAEPELRSCGGAALSAKLLGSITRWQDWGMEWILKTTATIPAWELRYGEPRGAAKLLAATF
jgi:hypothetical protein